MFGLRYLIIYFGFIFGTTINHVDFNHEDLEAYYNSGLNYYNARLFEDAKSTFEQILKYNWESSELYYNLGNTYYRLNDISGAVWAYEMCLYHEPTHKDAKFNLKLVNVNVKDRIDIPEAPVYLKLYIEIKERFTTNEWIKIFLVILILYLFILLLQNYFSYSSKINFLQNILFMLLSITMFLSVHSLWSKSNISEGVVYTKFIDVLSEPNIQSIKLFQVHEGLKISISQKTADWIEIELLDGKSGWVPADFIRVIH